MKIWMKLLAGTIIGALVGLFVPMSVSTQEFFSFLMQLSIRVGRYLSFPLVFFALIVGSYELKREKRLLSVYGKTLAALLLSAVLLVAIGILTILVLSPDRIPIIIEKEMSLRPLGIQETLRAVFPTNLFQLFAGGGDLLLPLVFLAFLLGINLDFDLRITTPVVQFFDSLNRISYHMNSLVVELSGFFMIFIGLQFVLSLRSTNLGLFKQILLILSLDFLLVIFGVYPALLYLLGDRENPYKWLYAAVGPLLAAFFSGDESFCLGNLIKHGKETFGVPRKTGSAVYALFAVFGRGGSALVASVSFILILKSYSSLEISLLQVLWTLLFALVISFTLGSMPAVGAYAATASLCALFGKGLQEGYLILRPVAPLLISFAVALDIVTAAFVSLLISRREEGWEEVTVDDFV